MRSEAGAGVNAISSESLIPQRFLPETAATALSPSRNREGRRSHPESDDSVAVTKRPETSAFAHPESGRRCPADFRDRGLVKPQRPDERLEAR